MSDGLFFTLVVVFFFVLWVVSGGPSKPISFAGPFITPITNSNLTKTTSGSTIGSTISSDLNSSTSGGRSGTNATGIPDTSSYSGHVVLTHYVSGLNSSNPEHEYLGLEVVGSAPESVDISGWTVKSTVSGASATIPLGVQMLQLGTVTLEPITLHQGDTAVITTGPSPVNVSFEQNGCSNYLTDALTYSQCFAAQNSDSNFLSGIWRIYLGKTYRLWKNSNDTIELLDGSGNVVDSFSY